MTGAAIATIRYSTEVKNVFTQTLSVALSVISTITVAALLFSTVVHAFVFRDLFANDIAIAISGKIAKSSTKDDAHIIASSSNTADVEAPVDGLLLPVLSGEPMI